MTELFARRRPLPEVRTGDQVELLGAVTATVVDSYRPVPARQVWRLVLRVPPAHPMRDSNLLTVDLDADHEAVVSRPLAVVLDEARANVERQWTAADDLDVHDLLGGGAPC